MPPGGGSAGEKVRACKIPTRAFIGSLVLLAVGFQLGWISAVGYAFEGKYTAARVPGPWLADAERPFESDEGGSAPQRKDMAAFVFKPESENQASPTLVGTAHSRPSLSIAATTDLQLTESGGSMRRDRVMCMIPVVEREAEFWWIFVDTWGLYCDGMILFGDFMDVVGEPAPYYVSPQGKRVERVYLNNTHSSVCKGGKFCRHLWNKCWHSECGVPTPPALASPRAAAA